VAGRIFVSYRRAETAPQAGWLCDRLAERFGRPQVVKDAAPAAAASCDVLLALIGHYWLTPAGPDDAVRLEIESALTYGVEVIPVLVDGTRMPAMGELPPSLAGLARRPPLGLGAASPELDVSRLVQALDQSIAERQATRAGPARNQPTVTGMAPSWPPPAAPSWPPPAAPSWPPPAASSLPAQPAAGQPLPSQPRPSQPAPGPTKPIPPWRRLRPRTIAVVACGAVAAAIVAFIAIPGGKPASSASASAHRDSSPKTASASSPAAASPAAPAKVLIADDFSTEAAGWADDYHQTAGAYTGTGAYRLSVTGANGLAELARPASARHGLGDATPLNLDVTVDVRRLSGAPQGYGLGIGLRSDGGGDVYAFLVMDHAVAIQKWVGGGARVTGVPAPVSTSALHTGAADRLRAVCQTAADGTSVHLELWLNGTKMVDYTDRDHPYTKGYMGLYVETISDAPSTAAAEFDNFTAAQIRG
jgi:hypothetical protein